MRNDVRDTATVQNAADPQQVRRARRKDAQADAVRVAALQAVMTTGEGRMVMWDLLGRAGVFRSVYAPGEEIRYLAGRQDFGHELMADLLRADEASYELMEREARQRARREATENEAAHTASADAGGATADA